MTLRSAKFVLRTSEIADAAKFTFGELTDFNRRLKSVNNAAIDGLILFRYPVLRKTERVNAMELKENLRRLRREAGITQEGLAEKLHVSGQAVSKWERGESYPEITLLPELAEVFHVTIDALLREQALTPAEIAEIVDRTWRDPATKRPLTPEESWAVLPEVEKAMEQHPEVWEFPCTLAQHYTLAADIRWQSGEREAALPLYRKVLALLDAVRYDADADNPDYSALENMRVMARYRLGDEGGWLSATLFRLPPVYYLQSMGMGKDFYYLSQHSFFTNLLFMNATLSTLALRDPAAGEARLYEELPGEEPWTLTNAEKLETLALSARLMELMGGGKPRGALLMQLVQARAQVIHAAAAQGKRERVLSELSALRAFCTPELLKEDYAISEAIRKTIFWRMGKPAPDGTPAPETPSGIVTRADAVAALTEKERAQYYTPISPLPALKYRYAGVATMDSPPLGLTALPMLELDDGCYDFLRDDPDFRAAEAYFRGVIEETSATFDPHP